MMIEVRLQSVYSSWTHDARVGWPLWAIVGQFVAMAIHARSVDEGECTSVVESKISRNTVKLGCPGLESEVLAIVETEDVVLNVPIGGLTG
eukprot:1384285-Amorphochlora_amoeboformis.AAC.1